MELSPLFIIVAIISFGRKLESLYSAVREKNIGKIKVETLLLFTMFLVFVIVYFGVKTFGGS